MRAPLLALPLMAACVAAPIPAPIVVPLGGLDPAGTPTVVGTAGATPTAPARQIAGGVPYLCDSGERIVVSYGRRGATIALPTGRTVELPEVESAAGIRYAADGIVWFLDGPQGILTNQGGQAQCLQV